MAEGGGRFAQTSETERNIKRIKLNSDHTLKTNKGSAKVFKEYLVERGESDQFEAYDDVKLDEWLGHFYMDLRKTDGSHYKANSLESIRHGINRHLKCPPFNRKIDIIKDPGFNDSNTCFKAVLAELKRLGKGDVEHYPIISEADLKTLYASTHLSITTPQGLFNKVQLDIRMFFCRRGNENMHSMTKETFQVFTDENTGRKYVKKVVDEQTKNHKLDKESSSGLMPEVQGSIYCPVLSFEMYMSKLNPQCDKLWQRPRDSFLDSDEVWYCNSPVGEKKLSTFLSSISKALSLSTIYTNHSIRATGASILSKCMYGPSQVMAVTGHKSVQSLSVYQRVSDEEKLKMGESLTENVLPSTTGLPALPAPSATRALALPSVPTESVRTLREIQSVEYELSGVNMDDLFSDFSETNQVSLPAKGNNMPAFFNNCYVTINNLAISYK